ncbi:hypothetical protein Psi02_65690 [Planotetraspora silvatica]|uniref:Uncharacterized protein n=1 Tax=Planotetraspora silvatica TaxID=234614 RepID=A0A8J3V527_9ACTN|nr:hypothetical protein Psi02_65690 [Planotetraspora silvatica]
MAAGRRVEPDELIGLHRDDLAQRGHRTVRPLPGHLESQLREGLEVARAQADPFHGTSMVSLPHHKLQRNT